MSLAYAQKQKVRITLELEVFEDFDAHNIQWDKLLDIQGNENVAAYVEDLSVPDHFFS